MRHDQHRLPTRLDHGFKAIDRVVTGGGVQAQQARGRGEWVRGEQQGVAVCLGSQCQGVTDRATSARFVVDDHALLEAGGEFFCVQTRHRIRVTTRRIRHDHGD